MTKPFALTNLFTILTTAASAAAVLFLGAMLAVAQTPAQPPEGAAATTSSDRHAFVFKNVGEATGLLPQVAGIRGHSAGWGDVDGDGWIDLHVGAFFEDGGKPSLFFRNVNGKFQLDDQEALRLVGRPTASLFADLDNDGDVELYISSMPKGKSNKPPKAGDREQPVLRGCSLFRNDGKGRFTDISEGNGACPPAFGGRSATALDFNGDGLLDLLVGEDPLPGYNGSPTRSTRLFRNNGNLQFKDVTQAVGIPAGIPGLGVAAADVNGDGWPDLFIAANSGGNLLFLNDGKGMFTEAPGSREVFHWKEAGGDNMVCGVAITDMNRDGLPDIAIGPHFEKQWAAPVPASLYLNRGIKNGVPTFENVTARTGLKPLPLKTPHVEMQDFDNDGWPDFYASMVKFDKDGTAHPMIYKNLGVRDGLPHFSEDVLAVNDYPTQEDKAIKRTGTMFDKIVAEKKVTYMAPGPSGDFDNDGRLDLLLASWWIELPSLLLRNETPGGHWVDVMVEGSEGVNRMGVGSVIRVYPAGKFGDGAALLGQREIATGYGYASAQPSIAHFGLGETQSVDIEVVLPHGKGTLNRKDVKANQRITIKR